MSKTLLVIYSAAETHLATTLEYLQSFRRYSRHTVFYLHGTHNARLGVDLKQFDAVWLNYCCRLCFPGHVSSDVRDALRTYRGLKLMAVQDEYDRTEALRRGIEELGFDVVFTCVPQSTLSYVYPRERFPHTEFITVLTGYVTDRLERISHARPLHERPVAIGYRARDIGARYGELGFWKTEIGRRMRQVCERCGIPCDIEIGEQGRLAGDAWYTFVESCRVVLGSESGSNVFDFDGSLEERYLALKRGTPHLTYEDFRPYIADREREINMGQISPRVFEAAALRTPMILLTGRYSGIVRPDEHYIELKKDFSNVDEVLSRLQDLEGLEAMAERAHRDLVRSGKYSYREFVNMIDHVIERKLHGCPLPEAAPHPEQTTRGADIDEKTVELLTELPTTYPRDYRYYASKELLRLDTVYTTEIERLNRIYRGEIERLLGEIERLRQT